MNPINPINPNPNAATFATVLNSVPEGLFKSFQTLRLWLKNDLISDPELILHKELWAYWEKNNYWKIVRGVIRSSFLVNREWEIIKEWKNIKATGHAERLLKELS